MAQRNNKATVYLGNLAGDCDEDLLFELGTQFGNVARVEFPRHRLGGNEREDFAFLEFATEADAKYFHQVLTASPIDLYGKRLRVGFRGDDNQETESLHEIGAKLCVRGLALTMDESDLAKHFGQFGTFAVPPKLLRTRENVSRGMAFISFNTFEAADTAIEKQNQRWLNGKQVSVTFADKPDGTKYGSAEDRALYASGAAAVDALPEPTVKVDSTPAWAMGLPNPVKARVIE